MQQVVDLEGSPEFQGLGIALLSVTTNPAQDLAAAQQQWRVEAPLLSDQGARVSGSYGVLRWAMPSGAPGHTFVLVGMDGRVRWVQDYGAPENGGRMNVPVAELYRELKGKL